MLNRWMMPPCGRCRARLMLEGARPHSCAIWSLKLSRLAGQPSGQFGFGLGIESAEDVLSSYLAFGRLRTRRARGNSRLDLIVKIDDHRSKAIEHHGCVETRAASRYQRRADLVRAWSPFEVELATRAVIQGG